MFYNLQKICIAESLCFSAHCISQRCHLLDDDTEPHWNTFFPPHPSFAIEPAFHSGVFPIITDIQHLKFWDAAEKQPWVLHEYSSQSMDHARKKKKSEPYGWRENSFWKYFPSLYVPIFYIACWFSKHYWRITSFINYKINVSVMPVFDVSSNL